MSTHSVSRTGAAGLLVSDLGAPSALVPVTQRVGGCCALHRGQHSILGGTEGVGPTLQPCDHGARPRSRCSEGVTAELVDDCETGQDDPQQARVAQASIPEHTCPVYVESIRAFRPLLLRRSRCSSVVVRTPTAKSAWLVCRVWTQTRHPQRKAPG